MKKNFIFFVVFGLIMVGFQDQILAANDEEPDAPGNWSAMNGIIEQ
jgi:hypothetical protein